MDRVLFAGRRHGDVIRKKATVGTLATLCKLAKKPLPHCKRKMSVRKQTEKPQKKKKKQAHP